MARPSYVPVPRAEIAGHPAPAEIEIVCTPVALGVNRTVTRTNPGGVMQYEAFWTIEKSVAFSVTEPHSVPPPELWMSKLRSLLCPTATEPKSRLVVETSQAGWTTAVPCTVSSPTATHPVPRSISRASLCVCP